MAIQDDVNLNLPLDAKEESKLEQINMPPNRAQAALNLHGDYYVQLLTKCNKFVFWHPINLSLLVLGVSLALFAKMKDFIFTLINEGGSVFGNLARDGEFQFRIMMLFPVVVGITACGTFIAYIITDDFKQVADKLSDPPYIKELFGFNLNGFARLPSSEEDIEKLPKNLQILLENGKNTTMLVYRFSPISIATVKPLPDYTTEDGTFFVKITGIQVRRVFKKVEFESLLLEWAKKRSTELFFEAAKASKKNKLEKLVILIDTYSFDTDFIKILNSQFYEQVSSTYEIFPFPTILEAERASKNDTNTGITGFARNKLILGLNKIFGVKKLTYALTLTPSASVEKIESNEKKTAVKKRKS